MNIQSITPNLFINNNRNLKTQKNINNNYYATKPMLNTLAQDTVSFSGTVDKVSKTVNKAVRTVAKKSSPSRIEQTIADGYEAKMEKYVARGNRFLDTLTVITGELQSKGYNISLDIVDSKAHMVKGKDSFVSKLKRSGESPMDRIRFTSYSEDVYDMKFVSDLISAFKARSWDIYMAPDKVSGRKVLSRKPDFDIRLDHVKQDTVKHLPEYLRGCIGKPQKSGYEDIQMRLVDTLDGSKDVTPIELLIVFGKNYSKAKHDESYYVYDISRALRNEMHISKVDASDPRSPEYRVKNNIGVIVDCLNTNISKPLFINGKSVDFYHEEPTIPVDLNPSDCVKIRGLLNGIRDKIGIYYRAEGVKASSEREAVKHIKATAEYKAREDKTITPEEIEAKKRELISKVYEHKKEDLDVICAVQARFEETAEKYGIGLAKDSSK